MEKTETIIMTISGGPRKDGASARMLQCFTESLLRVSAGRASGELSFVFRHYDAYDCGFAPCTDCRACRRFEGCVHRDMEDFWRDFENADGIVIASPIYNLSFPAPLKAIVDRMQRYYNARFSLGKRPPIVKRRPAVLLMAAGAFFLTMKHTVSMQTEVIRDLETKALNSRNTSEALADEAAAQIGMEELVRIAKEEYGMSYPGADQIVYAGTETGVHINGSEDNAA